MNRIPACSLLCLVVAGSVAGQAPEEREETAVPDDDSAIITRFERDLARICLPDGRRVGTDGHAEVVAYLDGRLAELGLRPYAGESFRLPFERDGVSFTNIVGVVPGADRTASPVLIGAHYDSVIDAPCADDNAAAVCVALEVARRAMDGPPPRDLVIALFDSEEPPWFQTESMGSVRFYDDQADDRGFHAALILDLVGHDVALPFPGGEALADLLFVMGAESHVGLKEIVEPRISPDDLKVIAARNDYVGDMSDHYVFRANEVPYLFLSCGRWEHYHEPTDTVDRLNLDKMASIAAWLEDVAAQVAAADLDAETPDGDFTVELECASFRAAFSVLDPAALEAIGLKLPSTRAELTGIARALLRSGL